MILNLDFSRGLPRAFIIPGNEGPKGRLPQMLAGD